MSHVEVPLELLVE